MKHRNRFTLFAAALSCAALLQVGDAATAWDKKLKGDEKSLHALNRLGFGPRPGDLEAVKKIGLDKWIDQQLNPSAIPETAALTERIEPLDSVRMSMSDMTAKYPPQQLIRAFANAKGRSNSPANNMTEEQRQNLEQLAERYRTQREKKDSGASAPKPPRPDLRGILTPQQARTLLRGTPEEKAKLFASLTPDQRQKLIAAVPPGMRGMKDAPPELRREVMAKTAPQLLVTTDLIENKLYRAIYSERQLEEVLVDFWFNHFNVYLNKGPVRHLTTSYERDAIRPHVLGKFKDMVLATAQHPAMLYYLDNWQSVDPAALQNMQRRARRAGFKIPNRARGLNENYGRELLELHTLGVDGGYSQKDVIEVARCFTGWTIATVLNDPKFQFIDRVHDKGEKLVLGQKIAAGGGKEDALRVIDIVSSHPSTAKFISRKLAQRFVADEPPQALVDRMAATFLKTNGDLREVMRTMIASREFFSDGAYRAKMKSPFEMVVSAARAINADVDSALALSRAIDELGQPLYRKEEPTGYYNTAEEWVSTAGLLARMNFSLSLAQGKLNGVKIDETKLPAADPQAAARALLHTDPSASTRTTLEKGLEGKPPTPALLAGLVLGSPDFQRR